MQKFNFIEKLKSDYVFRTYVFNGISFAVNLAFVIFNTVFAFLTGYILYGVLAGYYFVLSLLRLFMITGAIYANKKAKDDKSLLAVLRYRNYLTCGIMLLVMSGAMTPAIILLIAYPPPSTHGKFITIMLAAYTFYKVIASIVHTRKVIKHNAPEATALRNISLSNAAISLLSLENTMLATFSAGDNSLKPLSIALGVVVGVLNLYLAIMMIVKGTLKLKRLKINDISNQGETL